MVVIIFGLGLILGSFINALVWRLKTKKSVINGRSECPHCQHQLSALELVPVVSWIILRGRCRHCQQAISLQYPLIELITGLIFGLSYQAWLFDGWLTYIQLGLWLASAVVLIAMAVYDLKWLQLPNKLGLTLLLLALIQLGLAVFFEPNFASLFNHLLAAALGSGFFLGLYTLSSGKWMGAGDVKLVFVMGLLLGLAKLLLALLVAFNAAALISMALILAKRVSRKSLIPFGPFLIFATFVAKLFGQGLIEAYLRFLGVN